MSNEWIEAFLGKTGIVLRFLNNQYVYFSLVALILAYGIFITLASYNLKRIEKNVSAEITKQAKLVLRESPNIAYPDLIEKIDIDWVALVRSNSFFPYVTHESGFWVNKTNAVNVRDIIMHDYRKIHLTLERHGIILSDEKAAERKNLYLEYIHRITKK